MPVYESSYASTIEQNYEILCQHILVWEWIVKTFSL